MVKDEKMKVVVGLTNSADSKVAAYLLNRQGYEVLGVSFFFSPKKADRINGIGNKEYIHSIFGEFDVADPKEVKSFCQKLGIQHFGFNAYEEFKDEVVDNYVAYRLKTASNNANFSCSKLTLDLLYLKAKDLGADFISTGHYAKVHFSQTSKSYFLNAANDINSDQSFLLAKMGQDILGKLILPLGDLRKLEVNKIAQKQGWDLAETRVDDKGFNSNEVNQYIKDNVAKSLTKAGNLVFFQDDLSVGTHEGLHQQNFGQKYVGNLYQTTAPGDYVVVDINRYSGDVFIEKRTNIYCKKIFLNNLSLRKTAVRAKPSQVIIKIEIDPVTYPATIHFKNNNSCLLILSEKINKLFPSGTYVTIYEELIGGRLSVLGSGRVKYEPKFLDIDNDQNNKENKVAEIEF